ncbi:hypothetical protein [Nocardia sp. NPDC057455]|uniref:hypothetical protein n=1 Tax=Nocardia sp. NPDC057455 TaxID=3346138 RepID=UPI00366B4E89
MKMRNSYLKTRDELEKLRAVTRDLLAECAKLDPELERTITAKADAVRDLIPGEPWTLARIGRLRNRLLDERTSDWTDELPDEAPKLAQAVSTVKKAQFGEPGTILHNEALLDDDPRYRRSA